jgi:hypothetical protein
MSDTTKIAMWAIFLAGVSIGFSVAQLVYKLKQ